MSLLQIVLNGLFYAVRDARIQRAPQSYGSSSVPTAPSRTLKLFLSLFIRYRYFFPMCVHLGIWTRAIGIAFSVPFPFLPIYIRFVCTLHLGRAVDPYSFFADPDPAVFLNADLDPAAFLMRFRIQFKSFYKLPYEEFSEVEKGKKVAQQ